MTIAKVMGGSDGWDPVAVAEQASAPTNVVLNGGTLTWDDNNYVICWAIVKNGRVVDFTDHPSYIVDDTSAAYAVRAANEMGGLGEATEAQSLEGIPLSTIVGRKKAPTPSRVFACNSPSRGSTSSTVEKCR